MKVGIVEINWHDSKPVLTLDFHPRSGLLATGGGDHDIKLWSMARCASQSKAPKVSYISTLTYHESSVNILRFSPSGHQIASGADGGELFLWKLHQTNDVDIWKMAKRLLYHQKDVLDLQWSADEAFLISGSVDNMCIIWDVNKGCVHQVLDGHLHYVQGVAWDPLGHYVASLSSDRTCRIYTKKMQSKLKGTQKMNFICQQVVAKSDQYKLDDSKVNPAKAHLFHDETLPSFFRRLAWSPDGSFLLVPAGIHKFSPTSESINTAHIFSRKDFSRPAILLPRANKPIIAVRFCPLLFQRQRSLSDGFFKLPYRIVFAVATLNSVYLYDTESNPPIAVFAGLHYAAITDIAWSPDARFLAVSSQDCYCTVIEFENNELGSPLSLPESQTSVEENKNLTIPKCEVVSLTEVNNIQEASSSVQMSRSLNLDISSVSPTCELGTFDNPGKHITLVPVEQKETLEENKSLITIKPEVGTNMEIDTIEVTDKKCNAEVNGDKPSVSTGETVKTSETGKRRITPIAIL